MRLVLPNDVIVEDVSEELVVKLLLGKGRIKKKVRITRDGKGWSKKEDNYVKENYKTMPSKSIAKVLGRSVQSIRLRAAKLGCLKYKHKKHKKRRD